MRAPCLSLRWRRLAAAITAVIIVIGVAGLRAPLPATAQGRIVRVTRAGLVGGCREPAPQSGFGRAHVERRGLEQAAPRRGAGLPRAP